jgi:hypothetical protein
MTAAAHGHAAIIAVCCRLQVKQTQPAAQAGAELILRSGLRTNPIPWEIGSVLPGGWNETGGNHGIISLVTARG